MGTRSTFLVLCAKIFWLLSYSWGSDRVAYACLIHRVALSLGASFPEGSTCRIGRPIGQETIHQSRSHVLSSSSTAPAAAPDVFDPSEPFDPITEILTGGSRVFLPPRPVFPSAIPLSSLRLLRHLLLLRGWLLCPLTPW